MMKDWANAEAKWEPQNGGWVIRLGPCFVLLRDACPELLALNAEFEEAKCSMIESDLGVKRSALLAKGWRLTDRGWSVDGRSFYTLRRALERLKGELNKV